MNDWLHLEVASLDRVLFEWLQCLCILILKRKKMKEKRKETIYGRIKLVHQIFIRISKVIRLG